MFVSPVAFRWCALCVCRRQRKAGLCYLYKPQEVLDLTPFPRNSQDCGLQWGCLWPVCHPECRPSLPGGVRMLPTGHRDVTAPAGTTVQLQDRTLALRAGHQPDSKHAPATSSHPKPSTIIPFSFMINYNFSQTFNNHYSLPTPPIFARVSMRHFWSWDHTQENRVKMATNVVFVREECFACCFLLNHWKWHTQTRNCPSGARHLLRWKRPSSAEKKKEKEAYLDQFLCQYFQCEGRWTAPS